MTWHLRSLVGEAFRSFVATPVRSLMLVGLFSSLVGSLVLAELVFTDDLIAFTRQYQQSGGYVAIAASDSGLSASTCERLNDRSEVVAAGGVVDTGAGHLTTAPATFVSTAAVTPGLLAVWDPASRISHTEGSAVGRALASELALSKGTTIQLAGADPFRVGAVVDTEERNPYVSRSLFTISPPMGDLTECWVEFTPSTFGASLPYLQTLFTNSASDLTVRHWITLDEFARNPTADLETRPQRFAWILVAGLSSLITWLTIWFRRSELGLYRALGTNRSALLVFVQSELAIVIALALPIGLSWAIFVHIIGGNTPSPGQLALSIRSVAMAAAAFAVAGPLAALVVGRNALLSLLKDR